MKKDNSLGEELNRSERLEDTSRGEVELHLSSSDHDALVEFSDYWASAGLPPRDPGLMKSWQSSTSSSSQQQFQLQQHKVRQLQQQYQQSRYLMSGATSPTEIGTETGTQASESWAGGDDIVSTLSSDTDDADTESRCSLKRRRTTSTASGSSSTLGFKPLQQVKEGAANDEPDVRPWKVDIPDHDVVLGDTHEPTWGTRVYREVRKPYARKTITTEQLKHIKLELERRLEKEMGKKLPCPLSFWCNKESQSKTKPTPFSGFLKCRPGITYAYAKDDAIRDDVKNAAARSRTRTTKHFNFQGSLDEVIEKAKEACDAWVGDEIDKELYARGFREDLERMIPWRGEYHQKKQECEHRALSESVMRGTHMREAKIHEAHANHLETAMVDMINQLGNMMIGSHRNDTKRAKSSESFEDISASCGSRRSRNKQSSQDESPQPSKTSLSAPKNKLPPSFRTESLTSAFREVDVPLDMDLSPINVKTFYSNKAESPVGPKQDRRKDLSAMFSRNLRMNSSLEDTVGAAMSAVTANLLEGLPREVRPPDSLCPATDELSVLSVPEDLSVLFLEARESAIRRGIDAAALPQPGHVADRTKELMQHMKQQTTQNPKK